MSLQEINIEAANRLINHGPTIMVSGRAGERSTIMTAAWCMPVSKKPMLVAAAIGPSRFTHELIMTSREFVINVPGQDLLDALWCCGTRSGRDIEDKFQECGISEAPGKKVKVPLVAEALGAIECRLHSAPQAGDHTIMVGEVVAAWAREGCFDKRLLTEKFKTLHHLGGREFCLPGEIVRAGG